MLINVFIIMFIIASHIFIIWPVFTDNFYMGADNLEYSFRDYLYYSNSLRHGFGIPRWYPFEGGVPTGITNMNLLSLVPHRILGYLLYAFLPLKPMVAYKITIALGIIIMGIGWWLFLYQVIKSRLGATVGCLALLLGGEALVNYQQEQSLASTSYFPWILLVLIQVKRQFSYILILAILCGFSMVIHYPNYQLLSLLILFLSLVLTGNLNFFFASGITRGKILILLLSFVLFILAASPAYFIAETKDDFSSYVRHRTVMKPGSFEEYLAFTKNNNPATKDVLKEYLHPFNFSEAGGIGAITVKITIIQLILAIVGISYYRFAIPAIIILIFSVWASLGVNSSLPQLLFTLNFPFISYFRQWTIFINNINFCLSFLAALGSASVVYLLRAAVSAVCKTDNRYMLYNNLLAGILSISVITPLIYYSKVNSNIFMKHFPGLIDLRDIPRFDKEQFIDSLKTNLFAKPTTLFTYREWWDLGGECNELVMPQTTSKRPFATVSILNDINNRRAFKTYLKQFCNEGLSSHAVIASIPADRVKDINLSIFDLSAENTEFKFSDSAHNYYFSEDKYEATPAGAHLKVSAPTALFVVAPYSYKLGLKAYLNNKETETYPVYNGSMIGVFVPGGKLDLDLIMPFSSYQVAVLIQAISVVFIFIFLLYPYASKNQIFLALLVLIIGSLAYNAYFSGRAWLEEKKKQHIVEIAMKPRPENPLPQNFFPLTNSSLESWHELNNIPERWSYAQSSSDGGVYKEADPKNVKFGLFSARVTKSNAGVSQLYYTLSDEDVKRLRGKTILFGGWVKSQNTVFDKISFSATSLYRGQYPPSSYYQNTGEWEFVHFWYSVPDNAESFNLYFNVDGSADADAYFDGAVLAIQ